MPTLQFPSVIGTQVNLEALKVEAVEAHSKVTLHDSYKRNSDLMLYI